MAVFLPEHQLTFILNAESALKTLYASKIEKASLSEITVAKN